MAKIVKRVWLTRGPTGHRVRKVAWGYTLQVDGKQERRISAEWTKEQAQDELNARQERRGAGRKESVPTTLAAAAARYAEVKGRKRTIRADQRLLGRLVAAFGGETLLTEITAARVSAYKAARLAAPSRRGRALAPGTLNRELALLRHLLRLAHEEWEVLPSVPTIRLEKEPQGRLRFLAEPEVARLLSACEESQNPYLSAMVTIALNTGMRRGELLGLTWERVDFSRGMLLLEQTKNGRRREVPMNDAVYWALSACGPAQEGFVFHKAGATAAWGNIRTAFEHACRRAALTDFRFHDLRHTFASHMMMRGGSLGELRTILGHADVKMVFRYAHLSPAHLRGAVARLDGLTAIPAPMTHAMTPRFNTKSTQSGIIGRATAVSP